MGSVAVPPLGDRAQVMGRAEPGGVDALSLTTWNLGYAGLGADQDFRFDGGTHWRPGSRAEVERNLEGIVSEIRSGGADLLLLQEVARPSLVNRGVDVLGAVDAACPGHDVYYHPDVRTRLLPPPLRIDVGLALLARAGLTTTAASTALPREAPRALGLYRRRYQLMTVRIPSPQAGRDWVVGDLHLAAFDEGGRVRSAQLDAVRDLAVAAHQQGHHVVLGGDWNLRLAPTDFPHRTDERLLDWVHDLPGDAFPDGWRVVADPRTPTVRSGHQPYVAGDNYTAVIDGFVVSPEVRVDEVTTADLAFRHSDHQPVTLRVGLD